MEKEIILANTQKAFYIMIFLIILIGTFYVIFIKKPFYSESRQSLNQCVKELHEKGMEEINLIKINLECASVYGCIYNNSIIGYTGGEFKWVETNPCNQTS